MYYTYVRIEGLSGDYDFLEMDNDIASLFMSLYIYLKEGKFINGTILDGYAALKKKSLMLNFPYLYWYNVYLYTLCMYRCFYKHVIISFT